MQRVAPQRSAVGIAASVLALFVSACVSRVDPLAPSAVVPQSATPTVIASLHSDGLVLRAEHLQNAQMVEGIVEWEPASIWYAAFDSGRWWFSTPDWEWVMVPGEGRMLFGIWRNEPLSGDGLLGLIRFEGRPSIKGLRVWVDGQAIEGQLEDRHMDRAGFAAAAVGTIGVTRGTQGANNTHPWSVIPATGGPK